MGGTRTSTDPLIAMFLSLLVPGLGYLYAGSKAKFAQMLVIAGVLGFLTCATGAAWPLLLAFHFFQAVASAGFARQQNERLLEGGPEGDVPPPPPRGARVQPRPAPAAAQVAEAPAVRAAAPGPRIGPDEFLDELRDAWADRESGTIDEAQFSARKADAVARVRAADAEEAQALLEAVTELVAAGVLTPTERTRLHQQVSRP